MTAAELKALRDKRSWSQQQLAEILNGALDRHYTSATLSQWELGKRAIPKSVALFLDELALAEALGDTVGPPPPPPPAGAEQSPGPREDDPPGPPAGQGQRHALPAVSGGAYTRVCTELWEMIATTVGVLGAAVGNEALMVDAAIIDADKEALGRAWGRLAETNETFRRMLTSATSSGAWLEVALVTGGTASKLWRNHAPLRPMEPYGAADGTLAGAA